MQTSRAKLNMNFRYSYNVSMAPLYTATSYNIDDDDTITNVMTNAICVTHNDDNMHIINFMITL